MMKRKIVLGMIAALALLFVLPGCSGANDPMAVPLNSLPGPENLKVTAYEGMNLITWSPVIDATGYEVWRKDVSTGDEVSFSTTTDTYFKDWVSYTNVLVNGQSYEYAVIAVSALSTSSNSGQGIAVQSGVSRASVTANIPAQDAFTAAAIADADVTTVLVASNPSNIGNKDTLIVTVANTQPNYNYNIAYMFGKDAINRSFTSMDPHWVIGGNNKIVASFPVIGGENTINITASFGNFSGGYYNTAATTSKVVEASYVPSIELSPSYNISTSRDENGVKIYFENVPEADTYDIYKLAISGASDKLTVIGDWVKLTGTKVWDTYYNAWVVLDDTTSGMGNFVYALIASNSVSGAKSDMRYTTEAPITVTVPTISVATYGDDSNNVQITWDTTVGQTYKLEYAEVKSITANSNASRTNYTRVGNYTDMAITEAAHYPQGRGVVTKTGLPTGKNYIFRLSATQNGVTSTEVQMKYAFLTIGAFNVVNTTSLYGSSISKYPAAGYDVSVNIYSDTNCSYTLYRREASNPQTTFSSIKTGEYSGVTVTVIDTVSEGTSYEYKVVTSLGGESSWMTDYLD